MQEPDQSGSIKRLRIKNYMNKLIAPKLNSLNKSLLLFLSIVVLLGSCRTTKKMAETRPLVEKNAQTLIQQLMDSSFSADGFGARLTATVHSNKDKTSSFTATIRIKKDSIIWVSLSSFAIEGARISITKDSLKLIDRVNSKYVIGDFDYLNDIFQVAVNFEMLQSIIFGNYFSYQDAKKLKSAYIEDPFYILSTLSKLFPFKSQINVSSGDSSLVGISLEYSKVSLNSDLEFPFSIPPKYEKIK
jgi:hypothetical protein